MLDFLIDCGIEDGVIKDLKKTYSDGNIYNLNNNEFEVVKIIDYFREIGIEYIDELLIFNLEVFLCKFDEVFEKFNRYDIKFVIIIFITRCLEWNRVFFYHFLH